MNKSKRYFDKKSYPDSSKSRSHSKRRSRSRSPPRHHRKDDKSRDNKLASEKLKKAIQDQLKNASSSSSSDFKEKSSVSFVSLENQVKLVNSIDEINHDAFEPKSFVSGRKSNNNSINLLDIPLPKDDNSWIDNPRILINPKVSKRSIVDVKIIIFVLLSAVTRWKSR